MHQSFRGVLYLLNAAWGYGGAEVPAPQATLMKLIVEGIMGGDLPWTLVFVGVLLALSLEMLGVPVMPFAMGLYLPIHMNITIMAGGLVRLYLDSRKNTDAATVAGLSMDLSHALYLGEGGGLALMAVMVFALLGFSVRNTAEK